MTSTLDDPINVVIVGDEGVGKSSIISAYISRHFPQEVPHVMIDVRIPKELAWSNRVINIIDSSARPADRDDLLQKIALADTIAAVYDVTRPQTLESIVQEWLPLVGEVCNNSNDQVRLPPKHIIVFGNKCDLLTDEEIAEEKVKLRSIVEEYNINMLGAICSAMQLETIDMAFYNAVLISVCPMEPIYGPENGFTPAARRAFLRIFRMFDMDDDDLLSDNEISHFQAYCFQDGTLTEGPFTQSDIYNLKHTLSMRSAETGNVHLLNNCVTFEGLLDLLREAFAKGNYAMPWTVLEMCNYDDQLNFEIPPEIKVLPNARSNQVYELSSDAISFLMKLARHAYQENARPIRSDSDSSSDVEDCLTSEALRSIFLDVLPAHEAHPWSDPPTHRTFWDESSLVSSAVVLNSDLRGSSSRLSVGVVPQTLLLVGVAHADANVSFSNWINHWHLLAQTDPVLAQVLLFKLGYVFHGDAGLQVSEGTMLELSRRCQDHAHQQRKAASRMAAAASHWFPSLLPNSNNNDIITTTNNNNNNADNKNNNFSKNNNNNNNSSNNNILLSWFRAQTPAVTLPTPRRTVKICVLGDNGVGKGSFVWFVSGLRPPGQATEDVEAGQDYRKPVDNIVVGGCRQVSLSSSSASPLKQVLAMSAVTAAAAAAAAAVTSTINTINTINPVVTNNNIAASNTALYMQSPYFISLAAVPLEHTRRWMQHSAASCDLALLLYQCNDSASLDTALQLESTLPGQLPRLFVGTKGDLGCNEEGDDQGAVRKRLDAHTQKTGLPTSVRSSTRGGVQTGGIHEVLEQIRQVVANPEIALPREQRQEVLRAQEKQKQEKERQNMNRYMQVGSVALGLSFVGLLYWYQREIKNWMEQFFDRTAKRWLQWTAPGGVI